ncbi:hypothetical protein MCBG_04115 [Micromonospora sp. M42]|nr:hypothetical protein MCBG_04115 [Micromonospora sp. M42]
MPFAGGEKRPGCHPGRWSGLVRTSAAIARRRGIGVRRHGVRRGSAPGRRQRGPEDRYGSPGGSCAARPCLTR